MVVVDTSIWIEFFRQNTEVKSRILPMIEGMQVAVIEPIFAELLYGVRRKKDKELILSYWEILPKMEFKEDSLINASLFANEYNYQNMGVGLIDSVIIMLTLNSGHKLWTLDKKILYVLDKQHRFD